MSFWSFLFQTLLEVMLLLLGSPLRLGVGVRAVVRFVAVAVRVDAPAACMLVSALTVCHVASCCRVESSAEILFAIVRATLWRNRALALLVPPCV